MVVIHIEAGDLFGGEANWGLISGCETAKLEIVKWLTGGNGNIEFVLKKLWNGQIVEIWKLF